jgi:hypothetical protein
MLQLPSRDGHMNRQLRALFREMSTVLCNMTGILLRTVHAVYSVQCRSCDWQPGTSFVIRAEFTHFTSIVGTRKSNLGRTASSCNKSFELRINTEGINFRSMVQESKLCSLTAVKAI